MTTITAPTTISETSSGLGATGAQVYRLLCTYRLAGGQKVRVDVEHDSSYPQQSSYVASLWTPAGWVEVDRILGRDARARAMASGYSPDRARVRASAEIMAAALLATATAIVAGS